MKRYPWLKMLKKSDPEPPLEPPIWLGPWSNGEAFIPETRRMRRMRQRILDLAEVNAKKVGVDRRQFLASAMGMATTLMVMGCSDEEGEPMGAGGAGNNCVKLPKDAVFDESVACNALAEPDFIFDIQTHHYVAGDWTRTNPAYKTFFDAVGWHSRTRDLYIQKFFIESDTTMTVLSGLPAPECTESLQIACGLPISNEEIAKTRDLVNKMSGSLRMLNHVMVVPNVDPAELPKQLEIMEHHACKLGVAGWKLYPGFTGTNEGYFLDDEATGIPVIEKARSLNVKVFCIHKGLPIGNFFDTEHNQPRDIGVVAARYPDCKFVIYHSAICAGSASTGAGCAEGPYDPADPAPRGVNQLIRSMEQNNVGPNQNVYGELGTAWGMAFGRGAENAGHFMGKLLKYIGEDNVVWGSDSLNGPDPQGTIDTFRAFQIPDPLVQQYGYPQITAEIRAKVFGRNAATVFGIDPDARKCAIAGEPTAKLKRELDEEYGPRRFTMNVRPRIASRREFLMHLKKNEGMPG